MNPQADRSCVPCPVHPHESQLDGVVYRGTSGRSHKAARVIGCARCVRALMTGKKAVPLFWAAGGAVLLSDLPEASMDPVVVRAASPEEPGFLIPPPPAPPAEESPMKTCQVPGHEDRKAVAHGRCATCAAKAHKGGWSSQSALLDVERHHVWLRQRDNAAARMQLAELTASGELRPVPPKGTDTWIDLHWYAKAEVTPLTPPDAVPAELDPTPQGSPRVEEAGGSDGAAGQDLPEEAGEASPGVLVAPDPDEEQAPLPEEVLEDLAQGGEDPAPWLLAAIPDDAPAADLVDMLRWEKEEIHAENLRLRKLLNRASERLAASELCRRMEAAPQLAHEGDASWLLLRGLLVQVAAGRVPLSSLVEISYDERRSA